MKRPTIPVYNRATDGNVFEWILEAAKVVRQQRQMEWQLRREVEKRKLEEQRRKE